MKIKSLSFWAGLILTVFSLNLYGQATFTYQGQLDDAGVPATGTNYGIVFDLYSASTAGTLLGSQTNAVVNVNSGLFNVALDFGNVFDGSPLWLEMRVQKNGGAFTTLAPRQQIRATPYALFANNAGNVTGPISAGQLYGTLPPSVLSGSYSGTINLTNAFNSFMGSYFGNGGGLTNINLSSVGPTGTFTLISNQTASVSGGFGLTTNAVIGVGFNPNWLASADLNADGKRDLVTANISGGSLSVILNNGNGTFATSVSYDSFGDNPSPYSVVAVDVNNDGVADLVAANQGANNIEVFLNNGSGSFTASSQASVGNYPNALASGDFNNDGRMDIVTPNGGDNTLSVLTNSPSGVFVISTNVPVGVVPNFVVAADINNDSRIDLISADSQGNTITIVTNNGSGKFIVVGTMAVGSGPCSIAAADVSNDGKVDLLVANQYDSAIVVLTNAGNATFISSGSLVLTNLPVSVSVGDVNGDAKLDIVCGAFKQGSPFPPSTPDRAYITVLTNNGSGGFAQAFTLPSGNGRPFLTLASFNNDASLDVACSASQGNSVVVFTNSSSVGFTNYATTLAISTPIIGNGAYLTNLNVSNLVGTIPLSNLPSNLATTDYVTAATSSFATLTYVNTAVTSATNRQLSNLNGTATNLTVTSGTFSGDGGGLTNLPTAGNYLYVYDTTTQRQTNTFQAVKFNSPSQVNGWTRSANGDSYTCKQTGIYVVQYDCSLVGLNLFSSGSTSFSSIITVNNIERPGSEASMTFISTNNFTSILPLSKTFIASLQSNDVVQLAARDTSGKTELVPTGYGTTAPSVSLTIFRLK